MSRVLYASRLPQSCALSFACQAIRRSQVKLYDVIAEENDQGPEISRPNMF